MRLPDFSSYSVEGSIPCSPGAWSWEGLMKEALIEANKAFESDEVPVGAIIVNSYGLIIARAHNLMRATNNPCAHAEILAIQKASQKLSSANLSDCLIISSLEPCLMCAGAISLSKMRGIVFGAWDSLYGAIYSQNEFINLPVNYKSIWNLGGVLSSCSEKLLKKFFKSLKNKQC